MRALFAAVAAVLVATSASAEDVATHLEQLRGALNPGEPIIVTAASGSVRGRVIDISPTSLALAVDGQRREYAQDDVLKITQRRHGNIGKGIAWGAGIGAGLGLFGIFMRGGSDCGECLTGLFLAYTGIGAGIGAGIAASHSSDHLLFMKSNSSARVAIMPALGVNRNGVSLSVSW